MQNWARTRAWIWAFPVAAVVMAERAREAAHGRNAPPGRSDRRRRARWAGAWGADETPPTAARLDRLLRAHTDEESLSRPTGLLESAGRT